MEMQQAITFGTSNCNVDGLSSYLSIDKQVNVKSTVPITPESTEKKKRGRKKKEDSTGNVILSTEMQPANKTSNATNSVTPEGFEPYKNGYTETDTVLKTAIVQLDQVNADIDTDLANIRAAKTLNKKYDYISNLVCAKSSIIQSKIAAARELNSSTTKAYELELKRTKELNLNKVETNDDKMIMDMYTSMISMPYGSSNGPTLPTTGMGMYSDSPMYRSSVGEDADVGYNNYINNLTPEQNLYRYEDNPNVKEVILFDPESGAKRFAWMDLSTKTEVPNLPPTPDFLMENFYLDIAQGIAKSSTLGKTMPIITVSNVINKY